MSSRSKNLTPFLGIAAAATAGTVLFVMYYQRQKAKGDGEDVEDMPDMSEHLKNPDQQAAFITTSKGLLISDNGDDNKESEQAGNPISKMWQNLTKPNDERKDDEKEQNKKDAEEKKEEAATRRNFWGFVVPDAPDKPLSDKSLNETKKVIDKKESDEGASPRRNFWGFPKPNEETNDEKKETDKTLADEKTAASPTKRRGLFGLGAPIDDPKTQDDNSCKTHETSTSSPPGSPSKQRRSLFGFGPAEDASAESKGASKKEEPTEQHPEVEPESPSKRHSQSFFGAFFNPPPPSPTKSPMKVAKSAAMMNGNISAPPIANGK